MDVEGWSSGEDDTNQKAKIQPQTRNLWKSTPKDIQQIRQERDRPRWARGKVGAKSFKGAPQFVSKAVTVPNQSTPFTQANVKSMQGYSSSSDSGWSEDEAAPTSQPQEQSQARSSPPVFASQPANDRNRAERINSTRMETHYGMGFNLMAKMGLTKEHLEKTGTPLVLERREKNEAITASVEEPKVRTTGRKRSRSTFEAENPRLDSSDDEPVLTSDDDGGPASSSDDSAAIEEPAKIPRTAKARIPSTELTEMKEGLEKMKESAGPSKIIDMRGPSPQVHEFSQEALVKVWKQTRDYSSQLPTAPRQEEALSRLDQLSRKIADCEDELLRKAQDQVQSTRDAVKQKYTASPELKVKEAPAVKAETSGIEEEYTCSLGSAKPVTQSAEFLTSHHAPVLAHTAAHVTPLLLDWLYAQIMQWDKLFKAELEEVSFKDFVDRLIEIAANADLLTLQIRDEMWRLSDKPQVPFLANLTRIASSLLSFKDFCLSGVADRHQRDQIFDNLIERTLIDKFLHPWFRTSWNVYVDPDLGIQIMEETVQPLLSKHQYEKILSRMIVPIITKGIEESGKENFVKALPHLWISPWLPALPRSGVDAILQCLADTASQVLNRMKTTETSSLLNGWWVQKWKDVLSKEQWTKIVFQGVFGLLRRWLADIEPVRLTSAIPETISSFVEKWKEDLPEPLMATTIVDVYGKRVLAYLRDPETQISGIEVLDGYASWMTLRKTYLPELKDWLKEVLTLLDKAIRS